MNEEAGPDRDSRRETLIGPYRIASKEGRFTGEVKPNSDEHIAVYGEVLLMHEGVPYSLSTLVKWK